MEQIRKCALCFLFITSALGECPQGWTSFENSCYFFGGKTMLTYYEAQGFCAAMGGYVININGPDENKFVKSIAMRGKNNMWIGTTREIDQVSWLWYPSLGPLTFSDWDNGEGDTSGEFCAFLFKPRNYTWHDVPCRGWNGGQFLVLCEKPNVEFVKRFPTVECVKCYYTSSTRLCCQGGACSFGNQFMDIDRSLSIRDEIF